MRPQRKDYPDTDAGDVQFWADYRRWQAVQALQRWRRV